MAMEPVSYNPGEAIIREGEDGHDMFILESGSADVYKATHEKPLRAYHAGEFFGERALLVDGPRSATVVASGREPCVLYRLTAEHYQSLVLTNHTMAKNLERIQMDYTNSFLFTVPLLQKLSPGEREHLSELVETVHIEPGDTVIREGDIGYEMYVVELGQLQCTQGGKLIKEYMDGEYFGERALLEKEPRAATVSALTECRLLKLSEAAYRTALQNKALTDSLELAGEAYQQLANAQAKIVRQADRFEKRAMKMGGVVGLAAKGIGGTVGLVTAAAGAVAAVADAGLDAVESAVDNVESALDGSERYRMQHVGSEMDRELGFKEFEQLMSGPLLSNVLSLSDGDWAQRVNAIRQLRRAFDVADVDGNDQLEAEELEIVLLALDPSSQVTEADAQFVWAVLNPDGKAFLTWADFLVGMGFVRKDERAQSILNAGVNPNKWELISLLIDSPISASENQRLMSDLSVNNTLPCFQTPLSTTVTVAMYFARTLLDNLCLFLCPRCSRESASPRSKKCRSQWTSRASRCSLKRRAWVSCGICHQNRSPTSRATKPRCA